MRQTREVRMALRQEGDAALDRYCRAPNSMPRSVAATQEILIEMAP